MCRVGSYIFGNVTFVQYFIFGHFMGVLITNTVDESIHKQSTNSIYCMKIVLYFAVYGLCMPIYGSNLVPVLNSKEFLKIFYTFFYKNKVYKNMRLQ